uniref:Predicted gene 6871 n=1 Tax=Mus musculus TaxID=10090 RepID=E9Q1W9_MOUSE
MRNLTNVTCVGRGFTRSSSLHVHHSSIQVRNLSDEIGVGRASARAQTYTSTGAPTQERSHTSATNVGKVSARVWTFETTSGYTPGESPTTVASVGESTRERSCMNAAGSGLELRNPPASAFQVVGLKACTTTAWPGLVLVMVILGDQIGYTWN